MNNTHEFNLTSGLPAEVSQLTGKEQRILTEQKNQSVQDRSYSMLASVLKRVDTTDLSTLSDEERTEFIKNMLAVDKKMCLAQARQFSNDFDPVWDFNWDYVSEDPKKGKQTLIQQVQIGEDGNFPVTPIKDFNDETKAAIAKVKKLRDIEAILVALKPKVFKTYQEVMDYKFIFATLPISTNVDIRLRMLDGVGEAIGSSVKKDLRSSHTTLLMRNVCYKSDKGSWISFQSADLDKLPMNDLEFMRLLIKYIEGKVDTEIMFEHPEAELKPLNEKQVIIDLTQQLSFFFQSGTI